MKDLLRQYRRTLRVLEASRDQLASKPEGSMTPDDRSDLHNIESMMQDVGFAIRFMEQKRYPDPINPITRWATEKREILLEPDKMARIFGYRHDFCQVDNGVEPEDNPVIQQFLCLLSPREREVFLLIKCQCFPWREAANILGIHHGRINNIMGRVNKKIKKFIETQKGPGD